MCEGQLFILREFPSIGDRLYSFKIEESIVSEEKSLSFFAEDGIGV